MNCYLTRASRVIPLLAGVVLCGPAGADPTGTTYNVFLDAAVIAPGSLSVTGLEGHSATATFGGAPELIPADILPDPIPPFVAPNDLILTEAVASNPDGTETLSFLFEGQVPGAPFPTPGAPLFANPLDTLLPPGVILGILDLGWGDTPGVAAEVVGIDAAVAFDGGATSMSVTPTFADVIDDGSGLLSITLDFATGDLELPTPGIPGSTPLPATGLVIDVTIAKIPEPTSLTPVAVAWFGAFAYRRRPRRESPSAATTRAIAEGSGIATDDV